MMLTILDPGRRAQATEPLPPSTGTKFRPPCRYLIDPKTQRVYFKDSDGTLYLLRDVAACFPWPEHLTRDGRQQMAPAIAGITDGTRRPTRPARRRGGRSGRRAKAHDGPENYARAEAQAVSAAGGA